MKPVPAQLRFDLPQHTFTMASQPFGCQLVSRADQRIVWQWQDICFRSKATGWQSLEIAEIISWDDSGCRVTLSSASRSKIELEIKLQSNGIDFTLNPSPGADHDWLAVDFAAQPNEHYLGFGERFDKLDQRGEQIELWVKNKAVGTETYIPIPFFFSSVGYGLHIDTDVRCLARMATPDDPQVVSIRNAAPDLKFTLIPGRTPKEILSRYTAIAGRPQQPPDWVFGPWKSRDWQTADQNGIREDIEKQHELNLPVTVKILDARWEVAYHTFEFDPDKFPDPRAMIERLHAHGSRLVVWISPWMAVGNGADPDDAFYECAERGYLIRNSAGEVYVHSLANNPMLVGAGIDFTNPEAVDWWKNNLRRLIKLGVSGFNVDFGEQIPEDAVFYDGRTGREMHNEYPRLYNQLTFEVAQEGQPGVLLSRSGWHGSQKFSAIWAGDQSSDFADTSGLRSVIIAGQSAGLSGFPYWGSDIAGYFGDPSDEVYVRWTQLGTFSPIMMIHGAGRREPWTFSSKTLDIYRRYAQLHTDLFPYIQAYAAEASQTGLPIMRAMPLEFPDDPAAWDEKNQHQYFFGAELLVAPLYYGFSRECWVYLPVGGWRDFWTGEFLTGGQTVTRPAEIDTIPVLVRAGAIIPWLDPSPETLLPATAAGVRSAGVDLRLDIYLGADGEFQLTDETHFVWQEAAQTLTISNSPLTRQISVRRVGVETSPAQVTCNGQPIPTMAGSLNGEQDYVRFPVADQTYQVSW
jgi:alpha-D-xyloside xylohydrolase